MPVLPIYNITNASTSFDFLQLAREINLLSEGVFGIMFLITVGTLIFLTLRVKSEIENNVLLAVTTWFMAIFAAIFRALNLINNEILIIVLVAAIASIGLLWGQER